MLVGTRNFDVSLSFSLTVFVFLGGNSVSHYCVMVGFMMMIVR